MDLYDSKSQIFSGVDWILKYQVDRKSIVEAVRFQKSDFLRCELEFSGFRWMENQLGRLYDSKSPIFSGVNWRFQVAG